MKIIEEVEKLVQERTVLNRLDLYQASLVKTLPQVLSWKGEQTAEYQDACAQMIMLCEETKKLVEEVQNLIPNSTKA